VLQVDSTAFVVLSLFSDKQGLHLHIRYLTNTKVQTAITTYKLAVRTMWTYVTVDQSSSDYIPILKINLSCVWVHIMVTCLE